MSTAVMMPAEATPLPSPQTHIDSTGATGCPIGVDTIHLSADKTTPIDEVPDASGDITMTAARPTEDADLQDQCALVAPTITTDGTSASKVDHPPLDNAHDPIAVVCGIAPLANSAPSHDQPLRQWLNQLSLQGPLYRLPRPRLNRSLRPPLSQL
ncbi:hypothetical protein BD324DRAFT_74630 [Kockovaella imperatae]|uniref:Uncharacterized protein n=1 Tax=Kockovaella imperatae TaxID=4999 RepID=A0A1Y1UE02_9TREE|nr:hypothetical protein BD324DRAFT_74630 [Kockovaella imperatae]ORX35736.1 hypothetical protein BD324DRAFT_74630 [Kockovaella imperatae]